MNDIKRNVLLLFIIGSALIIIFQFFLNSDSINHKIKQNLYGKEKQFVTPYTIVQFNDDDGHIEDESFLALQLSRKVRVLCWVMTQPSNHKTKAVHVMATWGKRCNKIIFASESLKDSEELPMLKINTTKGREHLTAKTIQTFDYIYKMYRDEYDWFMKADDDTYVIVENLRYFLSSKNPQDPVFFGHHFHQYIKQGYFSGGAGYVLSKAALKKFGERNINDCIPDDKGVEDVEIGMCMDKLGVVAGDSRDSMGRSRFHCFNPTVHLTGSFPDWYYSYDTFGGKKGISSISDYAVSFHYVPPQSMYLFEFFLFHLRPYGILNKPQDLNGPPHSPTTLGQIIPSFINNPTTTVPVELQKLRSTTFAHSNASLKRIKKRRKKRKRTTLSKPMISV